MFPTAVMELYQSIAKQYQVTHGEMKKHYQAMKEQNLTMKERDQATQERDQAMKERDHVTNERDQAMKERDQAMKKHDQAMKEQNQTMKERDQATQERDQAMKERDHVTNERDQAMKERDQAMKKHDQAMKEQNQTMKERDQATQERDQAMKERDHVTNERDQAMKERDQAMKERDQAMRERDQAIEERDQVKEAHIQKGMEKEKEREQAIKERDLAMKECHQPINKRDQTISELNEKQSKSSTFWIVPRRHVTVLEKVIGGGAWGYVKEGRFRDQQVAVKCVHELILSKQTMQRVYREICTMSQVHHPNLVLFIAAVLDDQGGPMIITELLDTTLRKAYEDNLFKPGLDQCMDIFRDVASALCYLHELEEPIIHRDVSSANVLLKAMARGEWKAKLSVRSANWANDACTMGDGAIVYTAPEAFPVHPALGVKPPPQTTKIDVYSYGILLCEVTLREFPDLVTLHETKAKVKSKHASLHSLVLRCTETKPEKRPTMSKVLDNL